MNKEKVGQRLDLVGNSAGSIISVAAWCALQSSNAEIIMAAIDERMRRPSINFNTRISLLHVMHELLLTCAANGIPEVGKRNVLLAVSKTLPGMVQAVRDMNGEGIEIFEESLKKVLSWWSMLNIFPRAWIAQLEIKKEIDHSTEVITSGYDNNNINNNSVSTSIPTQLCNIANLITKYNKIKEEYQQSLQTTSDRVEFIKKDALLQLSKIRTAVENELGGANSLIAWVESERELLEGKVHNTGSSVKVQNEEDDVLGSFF